MRSSRVTPFLLTTLLCGALVAAGMGEGRHGMADDLESPAVQAPAQIEPESPSRQSADLSGEIDQVEDCAEDYYYCYGYEYAAQEESTENDVDVTEDLESEDYSYDSEELVYDEPSQDADVEDQDSQDYSEWDSEYQDYDDYEYASDEAQDVAPEMAADTCDEEYTYDYDEFGYGEDCAADDEEMEEEVASDIDEYTYEEDYVYDYVTDDDMLAADDGIAEEESEATTNDSRDTFGDDDQYDYEYDEEYSYDYEDEYMAEEYVHVSDEATESPVEDETEEAQEDGFSYDYDNYDSHYGYEYMEEDDEPVEAAELDAPAEETEPSYDYGKWEDEYESDSENESYDYTMENDEYSYQPETEDVQAESDSQLEESGSSESECDESAEWESEYDEYADYMYESEIENVEVDETENDSQFEESGSWESAYDESAQWESEYDESAEWESEYDFSDDEMETDTPAEDDLGVYGGFSDAYPEEEHAYPEPQAGEVAQEEPVSSCDADEFGYDCYDADPDSSEELAQDDYWTEYGYEYSYPETKYGSADSSEEETDLASRLEGEPGEPTPAVEECPNADLPCGVELFAWHPNELLSYQDQEILKTLERLSEDPSGVRRATLNEYLEEQGSDAIEFAGRFEDSSGIDVLGLADDLPGTAAFLGSFRLLQRGELGIDEAVGVLSHSLDNLSLDWIEGVREITADAFDDWDAGIEQSEEWLDVTATARPIVVAMVSVANSSISGAKSAMSTVSARFADLELSALLRQLCDD